MGNAREDIASQQGSYQFANGILSFSFTYTINQESTCFRGGVEYQYVFTITQSSTFSSEPIDNEELAFNFLGDFTYDTERSYSGAVEECDIDQPQNNYCQGSNISIGCLLDCD